VKAIILAAGLGKRMRPLTEQTPKPLLKVAGKYLIEFHLEQLAKAGITEVVINTFWLADQFMPALGTGERWGLKIHYSHEEKLLETAGGIFNALPLLKEKNSASNSDACPFLVINGDIYTEIDLVAWLKQAAILKKQAPMLKKQAPSLNEPVNKKLAYLALVKNPDHNPEGDFYLDAKKGSLSLNHQTNTKLPCYTYAGVGLYHPDFFEHLTPGPQPLAPLLKERIAEKQVYASLIPDFWLDIGTPERLAQLQQRLS